MFKALGKIKLLLGDGQSLKKGNSIYTSGMMVIIQKDEIVDIDPKPTDYTAKAWGFEPMRREVKNATTELRSD